MADKDAVVHFENVGLRYGLGPEVLRDITFSLAPGSFHFLMGPSGAGKSSLLKLMYLAHRPTRGDISLFGQDVSMALREEFRLLAHLPAFDNVALPLRLAGVRESEIRKHVEELLSWVGLKDHMGARPPTLSGGQQQRVAIARAVITRPKLLVADEPTGNVDDRIAQRLLHLFDELNKLGTTIVIATHNAALVESRNLARLTIENGYLERIPPRVEEVVSEPPPEQPAPGQPAPRDGVSEAPASLDAGFAGGVRPR